MEVKSGLGQFRIWKSSIHLTQVNLMSSSFLILILSISMSPNRVEGAAGFTGFTSAADLGASSYEDLNALFKDYLRVLDRVKTQPTKHISGQLNLRTPRSEVGDLANALRLYQLADLDRTYGSKNRPRFGKRSEISQDDVPSYATGIDKEDDLLKSSGIPETRSRTDDEDKR